MPTEQFDSADYDGSAPVDPQADDYYPNDGTPRRGRKLMHIGISGWWDREARRRVQAERQQQLDYLAGLLGIGQIIADVDAKIDERAAIRVQAEVGEPIREIES